MMISQESWIGYYNSYLAGEAKGAELISRLEDFAPGESELKWIKRWSAEEEHHHRLWASLVERKGIPVRQMGGRLEKIYAITQGFVEKSDWVGSMVSATVIEHISTSAAVYLYRHADEDTRAVFRKIVGDDVGHLDFDLQQLEIAAKTNEGREKIARAHKAFIKELLQWPSSKDLLDGELDILNDTYATHRYKLGRLGVNLPAITFENSFSFKVKKALIEAFG